MEDIKIFQISDIQKITHENLIYLEDNTERKLSLKLCAINYAHHVDYPEIEENRCIGERDWYAENPYFIFWGNPKVKFEIRYKKHFLDSIIKDYSKQKHYHEFFKIQIELQQFNWSTLDLS